MSTCVSEELEMHQSILKIRPYTSTLNGTRFLKFVAVQVGESTEDSPCWGWGKNGEGKEGVKFLIQEESESILVRIAHKVTRLRLIC